MPKKVKRSVSVSQPKVVNTAKVSTAAATRTSNGDFNPDYGYVIKDLKRIGILAGSFFVILFALSFFLR